MPDKEYNQEEQEYLIHRQELKYLMDKYPEDFKDWNDEEEPYSFFDVLKDTAKMGGVLQTQAAIASKSMESCAKGLTCTVKFLKESF